MSLRREPDCDQRGDGVGTAHRDQHRFATRHGKTSEREASSHLRSSGQSGLRKLGWPMSPHVHARGCRTRLRPGWRRQYWRLAASISSALSPTSRFEIKRQRRMQLLTASPDSVCAPDDWGEPKSLLLADDERRHRPRRCWRPRQRAGRPWHPARI